MPRFPFVLLVALLALFVGCTSNSSGQPSGDPASQAEAGDHPTPEIRSDGAFVYTFDGIEYPFPSILTFDDGAWVREDPIWNYEGEELFGYTYAHSQRPRKMLYRVVHADQGFGVLFQEGNMKNGKWTANGKERSELPDGTSQETFFVNGQQNGKWKVFGEDGSLESEYMVVDGERHGSFVTYRNGVIEASGIIEHGEIAILKMHDELGNPIAIKDMKSGETVTVQ